MGWLLLPYMVTLITKRTSPLNSHQKPLRTYITLMGLPLLPYLVTPITKQTSPLNTPLRTYITLMGLPLLPYMVTPITKRTSPLNSHQKTTLEHIDNLCVCHYCHIWSLRSQNGHHH